MKPTMQIEHTKDGKTKVSFGPAEWGAFASLILMMASGWLLHDRILTTLVAQGTQTEKRLDRLEQITTQVKKELAQ